MKKLRRRLKERKGSKYFIVCTSKIPRINKMYIQIIKIKLQSG